MLGKILIYITTLLALSSTIVYFISANGRPQLARYGRLLYYGTVAGIVLVSMYLLSNIVSHNFQFTYIWEYSSKDLDTGYLIASFYSGQQGSFLLWGLMIALTGYFIIPHLTKKGYEEHSMGFYSLILLFVMVILVVKSPFDMVWESYAGQVEEGFMPKDGRGLNPVLQNYWITIHPPILFTGYALMSVPFVIGLAGILKRDFRNWINVAIPTTLIAGGVLGLGLMLGGFWAYETLGWGGFWAWDPVENSSLIPWLVCVALIHTMFVARTSGKLLKTNYMLALSSFLLVLYATFLTRSGVLGDTSVHSFVSPGPVVYKLLVIFLSLFTIIGLVFFFIRYKEFPKKPLDEGILSKEYGIFAGSILIVMLSIIVLMGTSWPIFTEIFSDEKSSIDMSFYNQWALPIAIGIMLLNGISLYLLPRGKGSVNVLKTKLFSSAIVGVSGVIFFFILGMTEVLYLVTVFAVFVAIYLNLGAFRKQLYGKFGGTGALVAHIGIALMVLGALISGAYSDKQTMRMYKGDTKTVFGKKIEFVESERMELEKSDREKYRFKLAIGDSGNVQTVYPIVYWSDFNRRESPFMEPGISRYFSNDIYVSPFAIEPEYDLPPVKIQKLAKAKIPIDTNYSIQLLKFDMSQAMAGANSQNGEGIKIGGFVRISSNDFVIEDTLYSIMQGNGFMPVWYKLEKAGFEIGFTQLIPNKEELSKSEAVFMFKKIGEDLPMPKQVFTFEVSKKPMINLVWLGTILMVIGFFVAATKYRTKSYRKEIAEDNVIAQTNSTLTIENKGESL